MKYTNRYYTTPNLGLQAYFGRVRAGSAKILDTNFYGKRSVQDICNSWKPILEAGIAEQYPGLLSFENDLRAKVGPLSVMKPLAERMKDIDAYYDDILKSSIPVPEAARELVVKEWSKVRGLSLRSEANTVERMKLSTNSGLPYFAKHRRDVVPQSVPCKVRNEQVITLDLPTGNWAACAVLGWRGQEGGPLPEDVKQRVVWMFPFSVNVEELRFYQPAIEAAQRVGLVPAWISMDAVDAEITKMFDSKHRDDLIICTDFKRFDQHFNPHMVQAAQYIIRRLLAQNPLSDMWIEEVFPVKYRIPMMYDLDAVRSGVHGMGSGSGGTNFDETLVHRALQHEVALSKGKTLNPHSQCLGDDGILTFPGITVNDIVNVYGAHGQEVNADKQYASSDDCVYLRRYHHVDYRIHGICVGVYSTYRALNRLKMMERALPKEAMTPKRMALRELSVMENVKWHPLREKFAEFVIRGSEYRLGLDIPGFLEHIESTAREAIDLMPDFLGYTKSQQVGNRTPAELASSIKDWWIYRYLINR